MIKALAERLGFWLFFQNLNQHGSALVHGRVSLSRANGRARIGMGWFARSHTIQVAARFSRTDDDDISFTIGFPPFALYLHLSGERAHRLAEWVCGDLFQRDWSAYLCLSPDMLGLMHWCIGLDDNEGSSNDGWRRGTHILRASSSSS